jgi:hypothetical protein
VTPTFAPGRLNAVLIFRTVPSIRDLERELSLLLSSAIEPRDLERLKAAVNDRRNRKNGINEAFRYILPDAADGAQQQLAVDVNVTYTSRNRAELGIAISTMRF